MATTASVRYAISTVGWITRRIHATAETSVPSVIARNGATFCVATLSSTVNAITSKGPVISMISVSVLGLM